ncbi:MAG TPA: HAMP domain-containing sensor histidine kinase [Gemmatimonadaceae bacterium]
MLHAPSPSRRLTPEWATRLLLAFIVLSLASLIAIPWWASTRHLQPLQHEMNQLADPVRGLMTRIHLSMAQEGNALDDYVDERDAFSRNRFLKADNIKRAAYDTLAPLIAALGPVPKQRLDSLLALDVRWHQVVDAEVWNVPSGQMVPHAPAREDVWDDMLEAAARLDEAITQSGRERIAQIAEVEAFQRETTALLGLLALAAAAATWRLSRRVHDYALEAEERRATLAEVMASRARFMRGVSHDLKNPIHAIDGHAQLLEDQVRGPLNEAQQDSVARIRRSARAMMGLIEDLLELARAEAGQLTVKLDRVVLRDVVHEVVEEHRAAAQFAGLSLVQANDDSQTILTTDPVRVAQVLGNLLSNAIKYTPAGGHIEVRTEPPKGHGPNAEDRLAIHVVDDGPGIPSDKREEIFGEFTRLGVVDRPGAGLGLSIARRIARLLGGDVTVAERAERGSRFTLWLPVRSAA